LGIGLSRFLSQVLLLSSFHRSSFDLRSFGQHFVLPAEVNIGRRDVVDRFVIALIVVVGDEVPKSGFQLSWEVVVLELDHVLHRPVIALDLALGLRVVRNATGMRHFSLAEILAELA
jgi:hypothetical protein